MTAHISCEEFVELVTAYLDGALDPVDTERFEHHLTLCPGCDTYVEQFRITIAEVGELPAETLSSEAQDRLLAAFRTWKG